MCDVNETTPDGPALRSQAPARGDGWHVRVGRCAMFLWLERRLRRAVHHAHKSTRLRHISNLRTPTELRWSVSARDVNCAVRLRPPAEGESFVLAPLLQCLSYSRDGCIQGRVLS